MTTEKTRVSFKSKNKAFHLARRRSSFRPKAHHPRAPISYCEIAGARGHTSSSSPSTTPKRRLHRRASARSKPRSSPGAAALFGKCQHRCSWAAIIARVPVLKRRSHGDDCDLPSRRPGGGGRSDGVRQGRRHDDVFLTATGVSVRSSSVLAGLYCYRLSRREYVQEGGLLVVFDFCFFSVIICLTLLAGRPRDDCCSRCDVGCDDTGDRPALTRAWCCCCCFCCCWLCSLQEESLKLNSSRKPMSELQELPEVRARLDRLTSTRNSTR